MIPSRTSTAQDSLVFEHLHPTECAILRQERRVRVMAWTGNVRDMMAFLGIENRRRINVARHLNRLPICEGPVEYDGATYSVTLWRGADGEVVTIARRVPGVNRLTEEGISGIDVYAKIEDVSDPSFLDDLKSVILHDAVYDRLHAALNRWRISVSDEFFHDLLTSAIESVEMDDSTVDEAVNRQVRFLRSRIEERRV